MYWFGCGDGEVFGNVSCYVFFEFCSCVIDLVWLDIVCWCVCECYLMLCVCFDGGC